MKTLKHLLLVLAIVAATAIQSKANITTTYQVEAVTNLKETIQNMVKEDFSRHNNYFYKHNINRLKEAVDIQFYLDQENKMRIINTACISKEAADYVKELLHEQFIDVAGLPQNKMMKLKLKLDYRT